MPSVSAAQHRWIGYLHSNPEARKASGMSQAKVDEWLHSDRGSPWKPHQGGGHVSREQAGEILSRGRGQSPQTDILLSPPPDYGAPVGPLSTRQRPDWIPQFMGPDTTDARPPQPRRISNGGMVGYQSGGGMDPGGPIEPTAQTMSPLYQGNLQQFSQLPTDKLRELEVRAGASPQGGIIHQLLRQRDMGMAETNPTGMSPTPSSSSSAIQGYDAGGSTPFGPSPGPEQPMSGFLHGPTSGRADALKGVARPESYILPSEEVSYLGEGNGLMGARAISSMLNTGPHGIALPKTGRGRGLPSPPRGQAAPQAPELDEQQAAKGGGIANDNAEQQPEPVALSHGEYSLTPEQVRWKFGDGDVARGHRVLDLFVKELRRRHIKKLQSLKGPVGAKAA
jgi:hypothetical protein